MNYNGNTSNFKVAITVLLGVVEFVCVNRYVIPQNYGSCWCMYGVYHFFLLHCCREQKRGNLKGIQSYLFFGLSMKILRDNI